MSLIIEVLLIEFKHTYVHYTYVMCNSINAVTCHLCLAMCNKYCQELSKARSSLIYIWVEYV